MRSCVFPAILLAASVLPSVSLAQPSQPPLDADARLRFQFPQADYKVNARQFISGKFNANEWNSLLDRAGAKYFVSDKNR